jgi:hypothetical protein
VKQAKFLLVVLVCTLVTVGVSYGAWGQSCSPGGSVTTGSLLVRFTNLWYTSRATSQGFPTPTAALGYVNNDVVDSGFSDAPDSSMYGAHLKAYVSNNPNNGNDNGLANQLNVQMSGVYPGYVATLTVYVENDGTVPWILETGDQQHPQAFDFSSSLPSWLHVYQWIGNGPAYCGCLLPCASYHGQGTGLQGAPPGGWSGNYWTCSDWPSLTTPVLKGQAVPVTLWLWVSNDQPGSGDVPMSGMPGSSASFSGTARVTQWTCM